MTASAGSLSDFERLARYLVPPGQGVFAVSTGKAAREAATRAYLGCEELDGAFWREHLKRGLQEAVTMFAIPSDNGAGILRGAARGPEGIRAQLAHAPCFDLGDVFTIPHLLEDEMLSAAQIAASREDLFPDLADEARAQLAVSPLSAAADVVDILHRLAPRQRQFMLGGDHSVSWPVVDVLLRGAIARQEIEEWGILHFDAHTDLSRRRLGVDHCFATWAYHANELLGRGQRLLQLGIRASARTQEHWESTLGVRQIWARNAITMTPNQLAQQVFEHFEALGTRYLYVSNDIDGTDDHWAAACGTPEGGGLTPDHVIAVLERLQSANLVVAGGDLVEVAPALSLDPAASKRTLATAADYTHATLALMRARGWND